MTGRDRWPYHPVAGPRPGPRPGPGPAPVDALVGAAVGAAVVLCGWVWASGQVAGWLARGRWPAVPATSIATIVLNLPSHLGDPRAAGRGRPGRPCPGRQVCTAARPCLVVAAVGAVWLARHRLGPTAAARVAGPRTGWAGGARWAGSRDLRDLRVHRPERSGRLVLGRGAGPLGCRSLLATEARHSVLVVGPTQSGKTSGLAVPALLEWQGPVIATSVKDDLASATLAWRSRHGPAWVFDPTQTSGLRPVAGWSPLAACPDWSSAQRVAGWMVEATPARSGMADAAFWYAAAAKQLAPLLLAAERGGLTTGDVVRWTNSGDFDEPSRLLEVAAEPDAAVALAASRRVTLAS